MPATPTLKIDMEDVEGPVAIVKVTFDALIFEMIGEFVDSGNELTIYKLHIQGAGPGQIGHKSLCAIATQVRGLYGYKQIIIHGARRTSGRRNRKLPSKITFK